MKRITVCNCLCSSSSFFASVIRNIRAKNYFTDHRTANTIHGFRDSILVLKTYKNLEIFHSYPSDNKARTVCWCKQPTSNSFQTLQTVYTYSICTIDQLLSCWEKCFSQYLQQNKQNLIDFMNGLYLQCEGLEEVEKLGRNECTLHRWRRSPVMSDCSRPYQ